MSPPRVLLISPYVSETSTGEAFVAFKWAEALQDRVNLTVAAFQSPQHVRLQDQLPKAQIVTWPMPRIPYVSPRLRAMLKPDWFIFCRHLNQFLENNASQFDIAHQIMPQAMRYASPLRRHSLPYVIGPLGGSLPTPRSFRAEMGNSPWFTKLRFLDAARLRIDPWLRSTYCRAEIVFGVAPYVGEQLDHLPLKGYADLLELGVDAVAPPTVRRRREGDPIRLLHVGRGVRNKGLRDVIRAMALLKGRVELVLTSAGEGEDIALCKKEADRFGIAGQIRFLGLLPRVDIEALYAEADIFVFPSFREPAGNVLYEAMRWGLPVITAARGGPDSIVDDTTGIRVPVSDPATYAADIATALLRLALDEALCRRMGEAGRSKIEREGLWAKKADHLVRHYLRCLAGRN